MYHNSRSRVLMNIDKVSTCNDVERSCPRCGDMWNSTCIECLHVDSVDATLNVDDGCVQTIVLTSTLWPVMLLDAGDCPLPVVQHGYVFGDIYGTADMTSHGIYGTADMTSHGQAVYYTCEPGYVNGSDVPRCNNGTWTADALCTPGTCRSIQSVNRSVRQNFLQWPREQGIWANARETRGSISLILYAGCPGLSPVISANIQSQ